MKKSIIITVMVLLLVGLPRIAEAAAPSITSLSPTSGAVNSWVTINGANFGVAQGTSSVTFNGTTATVPAPQDWNDTSILVPVPSGATKGNVVVTVGNVASNGVVFTVVPPSPNITALSPTAGGAGASVTITGTGFGATQSSSTVTFNGTATTPTFWSDTSIGVLVPSGATSGNVVVTEGGVPSNGVAFTVSPITYLQGNSANTSSQVVTLTVPYTAAQTAGNLNVVAVGFISPAQIQSVTDTKGNIYSLAVGPTTEPAANQGQAIYYAKNIAAAAANANSVTVKFSANTFPDIRIAEYRGLDTSNPLDVSVAQIGELGAPSSGSATTTSAPDLLVGAVMAALQVGGVGPGYTGRVGSAADLLEDEVVTTAGSYSATETARCTKENVCPYVMQMVAFKQASSGPPTITSLSPTSGIVGTTVTITGTNFGTSQGTSTVKFNGTSATPCATCWSATSITVAVPSNATTGNVVVTVGGVASNGVNFTVTPSITSLSPTSGPVGTSVTITGTTFGSTQGTSTVTFNGTSATPCSSCWSATSIVVPVPSAALTGNVVVTVGGLASNGVKFSVLPVIGDFNPKSASAGAVIALTGTTLTSAGSAQVILNQQGGGTIAAPVASASGSAISFVVPSGAASGPVTVTTGGLSAVSTATLNIVASSSFTLSVGPSSASVQPGTSVSYSVSLNSSNGFSQLADLSVTGLPSGATASFSPVRITAGQFSILTITAPASQPVGSATLTISVAATVQGIPSTQSASATLNVQAATTSLIGRIVESDNIETPIPGITATFLGVDDAGNKTGCSGQTRADAAGNFAFTNLGTSCLGRQLVAYDGNTATDGEKYAGVNLAYTMTAGQITGPELVHLPAITSAETIMVKQNATVDQTFSYSTIPGIVVTVYAGTTLTLPDGTQPDPFPMAAVLVPVDRLPDAPTPTAGTLRASIVAFQPADTNSNQPVSVTFPNVVNTPPGVNMELDTLDPIVGELVKYGTGTVSADATQIVPDSDPGHPGHRFGISHFDWHGPMAPAPNSNNPSPDPHGPKNGDPVDTATGLLDFTKTDIAFGGSRGMVAIQRTYRTLSGNPGPFGVGTNHNYGYELDVSNLLRGTGTFVTLVTPDGNQFQFTQQGVGTFVNSTIPSLLGVVVTNPSSGTYSLRWKNGTVFLFQTSSQGALLAFLSSITDPNGNATTLVRGNSSQPVQITQVIDPVGRPLNISYDNFNRILSLTDPIGRTVQYTYNSQGTLATVTDPAGGVTTYAYDSQNRIASITDPRNITYLQNTYDANGRVIQQTAADGGVTTFAYTLLNPTVSTSPVLLTTVTDPRGNATTYHFNTQGFLVDITDALGEQTIYTRDPGTNQVLAVTDPLGRTTAFTYDSLGNQTSITRLANTPNAATTSFTYDAVSNQLTGVTDPLGHTTVSKYDGAGNLLSLTDPLHAQSTFSYDTEGEMVKATDALGNVTSFSYANGRLVSVTDSLGRVTSRVTDAVGRVVSVTNPLGQTIQYQYDPRDLRTQVIDAAGNQTQFVYDGNGNLTALTDARQHTISYTYDSMDRVSGRTDPLNHAESYQYDRNGNMIQFTDRRGIATQYGYDALDRRNLATFGTVGSIRYSYDAGGRLTHIADSVNGTIDRSYDGLNNLAGEKSSLGAVSYTYDLAGRRASMSVSGQPAEQYSYDASDRVISIAQGSSNIGFNYDVDGQRITVALANGVTMHFAYDAASQLTGINYSLGSTTLGNLTYSYDGGGRRISVGGTFARLGLPSPLANTAYNSGNQLTQLGQASLTYDSNGNLTSDGVNTYNWDVRNQLASITGSLSANFQYDPFGRRTSKTIGSLTTSYLYDGDNPVQELSTGTPTANLLTGLAVDEYFQRTDSNGALHLLTDALGSTVAALGADGKAIVQYTYEPFGNTSPAGSSNSYQYTGRENDGTGLYFYRARYYNPLLGRFISEDPVRPDGTPNFYAYVGNDPVNFIDPFGADKRKKGFGDCLKENAHWYSLAGISDLTIGTDISQTTFGNIVAGNDVTGLALAFVGDPENDPEGIGAAVSTSIDQGLRNGIGSPLLVGGNVNTGPYIQDFLGWSKTGKMYAGGPGRPEQALARGTGFGKFANLLKDLAELKEAVDLGLAGALALDCALGVI